MKKIENKDDLFDMEKDPFYNISSTSSTTECTGLTPSGVLDQAESEAYGELYAIHPPKAPDNPEGGSRRKPTS